MPELVFRLPDVGEGLTEAEIVSWKVQPGQEVSINEIVVEIETAKSVVELPSPHSGTVHELHYPEGSTVPVGEPIITFLTGTADSPDSSAAAAPEAEKISVLVGYGPAAEGGGRRRRAGGGGGPTQTAAPVVHAPLVGTVRPAGTGVGRPLASPPVRQLARQFDIDLTTVAPTGGRGQVTRQDVLDRASVPGLSSPATASAAANGVSPAGATVDSGDVIRVPVRGVRKATAAAMVASAFTAPHVTEFLTVDVTATLALVQRLRTRPEFDGLSVTPLVVVAKALTAAVAQYPEINATWDAAAGEIVQFRDVNLGIAAATPRGLMVPNIPAAQKLSFVELSRALTELISTARDGKTAPAQLAGGTITITNIGSFGVDAGTPILNPGEAAILCMGAVRKMPWVVDDEVVVRSVMTLSLAFDHRLVDGDLGSRVLARVGAILRDPLWELVVQ